MTIGGLGRGCRGAPPGGERAADSRRERAAVMIDRVPRSGNLTALLMARVSINGFRHAGQRVGKILCCEGR